MPETPQEWVTRLEEMLGEISPQQVSRAFQGNAQAKTQLQALMTEAQAAAVFIAKQSEATAASLDQAVETVNIIIDTLQAILLAIGIYLILKKIQKRKKKETVEISISRLEARRIAGDRASPRPSATDTDKVKDAAFLYMRLEWSLHYLLTLMKGLAMRQALKRDQVLVWHAHLDKRTCSICKTMDGEKTSTGDFLPLIMKKFPTYKAFGTYMTFPHAHPRCRCYATVEDA